MASAWRSRPAVRLRGWALVALGCGLGLALISYNAADPSLNASAAGAPSNWVGRPGAAAADLCMQSFGMASWLIVLVMVLAGLSAVTSRRPGGGANRRIDPWIALIALLALAGALAAPQPPLAWPLARGLGGFWGDAALGWLGRAIDWTGIAGARWIAGGLFAAMAAVSMTFVLGLRPSDIGAVRSAFSSLGKRRPARSEPKVARRTPARAERGPALETPVNDDEDASPDFPSPARSGPSPQVMGVKSPKPSRREERESQGAFAFVPQPGFRLPELSMLAKPKPRASAVDEGALRQNARLLEGVLAEFGVNGRIDQIRPGPVVTLYELVPAPGVKTARVVALADDIARSMSVVSCRVAVAAGRNAIGIELPNAKRETVYLRDLLSSTDYERSSHVLPMALGETIGGEPYVADLARMPHLLIAGTTGSGKSVGVNAMILSILYRLSPTECRMIMVDPKMLELSVYDGIPHLLAPVVTDPKKAIVALKWTVREMEDRYRRMSKIGVRNIAGYNEKAKELAAKGEHFVRTVQTGFDETGRPTYEEERLDPEPMPYLVVVIDEVADLMMVAGKDIEGAVQRLAQMARAAGIHLIMATQRPSVDVITGTIKANFPTRISFQVTSKIDARTILGEQGAEQLLGQGDMLYMAGGGRVTRLHGPFVSDGEVEAVAAFLRRQGEPQYLEEVTAAPDEEGVEDLFGETGSGDDLYDRAVAVVTRDRKASTSYIQRRLQIGYNRAASLIERMEQEGVVGPANHAGKRDVLAGPPPM
jgi:S-DNA-T family DNA segregation ATPase FtsK/SpoIIIE